MGYACPLSHPQREKRRQATMTNQQQLDLLPQISTMYEQFLQQVDPGDVLTVMVRIQRL
jgi:hypothetical protein